MPDRKPESLESAAIEIARAATLPSRFALDQVASVFEATGEAVRLLAASLRFAVSPAVWADAIAQMATIGVNSLSLVMITVCFSGMVLALYSSLTLVKWGVGGYIGGGLALSITREVAPILTAVVVAARAGSAIAAELGTMKVTEQIDALRSLALNPVEVLVAPRILASVIVFPMLTAFAIFTGTGGGYVVAVMNGVPSGSFAESIRRLVCGHDISMGLLKAAIFGLVVSVVCCQQGMRTTGGATGVGRSTTNAVVISIVMVYILNFFLAYLMFGGKVG